MAFLECQPGIYNPEVAHALTKTSTVRSITEKEKGGSIDVQEWMFKSIQTATFPALGMMVS